VIVEYTRYQVADGQQSALERAYEQAQSVLVTSPHCLSYELSHCLEDPTFYVLRIEWDSLDGHLQGFRQSAEFQTFMQAVGPFFSAVREMRHYEVTRVTGKNMR
jgi:heme-degrading monooxygenase HmoA